MRNKKKEFLNKNIEICAVGGYSEFGRNMTAVRVDNEVVIIDMGIHMENYIRLQGDDEITHLSVNKLLEENAIPKIGVINHWKKMVKAIIPTHAHLDHVGAIPYISNKYDADILATPFTAEVIKSITADKNKKLKNRLREIHPNSGYRISENLYAEFIHVTHSTPQTVMVALHTKYGILLYANDFKFDSFPTLGSKPNFKRLKELDNVIGLIVDCTRAVDYSKCPSESVAKEMLKDVMMSTDSDGKAIIVTTFSSHLARLKSIIEFAKQKGRKIIMLGRSLDRYVSAGQKAGIINFKDIKIIKYKDKIRQALKQVSKKPSKYLLIVTGHQGEPEAVLSRMSRQELKYNFQKNDHVIFSCSVIPNQQNIQARDLLEENLKDYKVRIFKNIHVSGHAAREDLRDLINMVSPKKIIPAHGNEKMMSALKDLAEEMDFDDEDIIMMHNGNFTKL